MFKRSLLVVTLAVLTACGPAPQPPADGAAVPATGATTSGTVAEAPAPAPVPTPAPKPVYKPKPAPQPVAAPPPPPPPPVVQVCSDCGVITSVTDERVKGEGSAVGVLGGAAAGGVAGSQFGKKSGKVLATVGGAILGGFAGREAERQIKAEVVHHVTVAMDDGSTRRVTVDALSGLGVGSKVRVSGENLVPN